MAKIARAKLFWTANGFQRGGVYAIVLDEPTGLSGLWTPISSLSQVMAVELLIPKGWDIKKSDIGEYLLVAPNGELIRSDECSVSDNCIRAYYTVNGNTITQQILFHPKSS